MKIQKTVLALGLATLLSGCQGLDNNGLMQSGAQAFQAYTLSDDQVKQLSDKSCEQMDKDNQVAPANSEYQQRLNKIAAALGDNINGVPANYKVYQTKDVNAWAMANGCIRVYSGLMDMMTDNEVEGVLGHEMGHVALGHTRKAMQLAYATTAARTAAASVGGVIGSLSQSQLGEMGEKLVNINPEGLVTSFEKLAKLEQGRQSSMFDSHPASEARAEHIRERIAADAK